METITAVQASCAGGSPPQVVTSPEDEAFIVAIMETVQDQSRVVALEAVLRGDLAPLRDYVWFTGMRTGLLPPDLGRLAMRVLPGPRESSGLVDGFTIELADGDQAYRQRFTVHHLSQTAARATARLIQQKKLDSRAQVHYYLVCQRLSDRAQGTVEAMRQRQQTGQVRVVRRQEPLPLDPAPLADYVAASEPLLEGQAQEPVPWEAPGPMPVFFNQEAWDAGHAFARRGNDQESAAVWTGRLFRDTASPEVFAVVDACIDARHAAEQKFSVTFSGETWSHIRHVLARRRARLNRPHEIILGSVHGHNFTPGTKEEGDQLCDTCPDRETCQKTTAVVSTDDVDWHRSVFGAQQAYTLLTLWGWTARKEEVWQCYSLHCATLAARPLRVFTTQS